MPRKPKGKVATPKVRRPREDLLEAYQRNKRLLESGCTRFDEGSRDDAFLIAVLLRGFLHYGQAPPLLHQAGIIKKLSFVDTGPNQEGIHNTIFGGLVQVRAGIDAEGNSISGLIAPLEGDLTRTRPYTPWWKSDLVVQDPDGKWRTRQFLVTQMANTEAAHFDPFLDADYEALRNKAHGWSAAINGEPVAFDGDLVTASIRQVAWEILATLDTSAADQLVAELEQRGTAPSSHQAG